MTCLSHYHDKIPNRSNRRENPFILVHGLRGIQSVMVGRQEAGLIASCQEVGLFSFSTQSRDPRGFFP